MEDRFTRGFIAGIIGGLAMNVWSWIASPLNLTTMRMADWAGVILYGHRPPFDFMEVVVAQLGQLVFTGILGVVFAYLITLVKSQNIMFKGWLFSTATWFFIYAITTLFKVEGTIPLPVKTVVANFVSAAIYGLVLGGALTGLTAQHASDDILVNARSNSIIAQPAMKPTRENDEMPDD